MKGCLITLLVILIILMILVTAAVVVFFGFEKDIPEGLAQTIRDEIAGMGSTTFNVDYNLVNEFGDVNCVATNTISNASGEIEFYGKVAMSRTGKDATLVVDAKFYDKDGNFEEEQKYYIEDGKYMFLYNEEKYEVSEEDWKYNMPKFFAQYMPFEEQVDESYKLEGGEYLENFSRITQKGMNIKVFAYNGDDEYVMSLSLKTGYTESYKMTLYTKEDDKVVSKQVLEYAIDLDLSKFAK